MAEKKIRCCCCRRLVPANPRVKNQKYCGSKECQAQQRKLWQKEKLATDEDYRQNRRDVQRRWRKRNRGYWSKWRRKNPHYVERNRAQQSVRNKRRRLCKDSDCKDESLQVPKSIGRIDVLPSLIAKCESLDRKVKQIQLVIGIPT